MERGRNAVGKFQNLDFSSLKRLNMVGHFSLELIKRPTLEKSCVVGEPYDVIEGREGLGGS